MGTSKTRASKRLNFVLFIIVCLLAIVLVVTFSKRRAGVEKPGEPVTKPSEEVEVGTKAVILYFGSEDGTEPIETTRDIMASAEPSTLLASIMRELISGPTGKGIGVLPPGTLLRSAYIAGRTAYLDFSGELKSGFTGGSTEEYLILASIVRTVSANFVDITHVQILVEGSSVDSLGGHYDLTEPLSVFDWQ
ncbi:MAG: GerMN domain-containing protein [Candidatus Eisenbacteria bacterium]|nr:GerMN domain-containing protein [Candidatus Eisenbacteria bacterium]